MKIDTLQPFFSIMTVGCEDDFDADEVDAEEAISPQFLSSETVDSVC